jgi:transposase-like protein
MKTSARARYAGYRFPSEIISHAVWLYFRFPLGLRICLAFLTYVVTIAVRTIVPDYTGFRGFPDVVE